jgi:hypothetical protein
MIFVWAKKLARGHYKEFFFPRKVVSKEFLFKEFFSKEFFYKESFKILSGLEVLDLGKSYTTNQISS